jgi:hypothetical protein
MIRIKIISADSPSTFEAEINEFITSHDVSDITSQVIAIDNKPHYTASIMYYINSTMGGFN